MIIDCIGCLHGFLPALEGGDLLIITGDITARDTEYEYADKFLPWLIDQQMTKYKKVIWIGGNHDNWVQKNISPDNQFSGGEYLCDSGTEFSLYPSLEEMEEGKIYDRPKVKIWGSPWTKTFPGINPHCCAFTADTDEELSEKWALIPTETDILITHSPPFTIRDLTTRNEQVGSPSLMAEHISRIRPKLWAFSHIHEAYGQDGPYEWSGTRYVNCSIMNEKYQPINKPIRIVL